MGASIDHLLSEGIISEVLGRLQSGKEAEVYVVRYGTRVVAAKVYKDHVHRSFKNNAAYKEGRSVRNSRSQRAIDKGSRFGKDAAEDAWKSAEVDALYRLHAAGVRVPAPVMYLDGVLLMELITGPDGDSAPRLIDCSLNAEEANAGYHDMLRQLVRMLHCELIHGDLSPYNVLRAAAGNIIIDFPQIVSASHNSNSEMFFMRDAQNILGYFADIDPSLRARRNDPGEIWRAYVRRELTPDFVPTGRGAPPARPPERPQGAQPQHNLRAAGHPARGPQLRPGPAPRPGPALRPGPAPHQREQPRPLPQRDGSPRGNRPQSQPQRGGPALRQPPPAKSHPPAKRGPRMPEIIVMPKRLAHAPADVPRSEPPQPGVALPRQGAPMSQPSTVQDAKAGAPERRPRPRRRRRRGGGKPG